MTDNSLDTTIRIPQFLGTRARSKALADTIEVSVTTVTLDFTDNLSTAQGACDELIRELIQTRNIDVRVRNCKKTTQLYLRDSSVRREVFQKLILE